jgi:hypothetical protein
VSSLVPVVRTDGRTDTSSSHQQQQQEQEQTDEPALDETRQGTPSVRPPEEREEEESFVRSEEVNAAAADDLDFVVGEDDQVHEEEDFDFEAMLAEFTRNAFDGQRAHFKGSARNVVAGWFGEAIPAPVKHRQPRPYLKSEAQRPAVELAVDADAEVERLKRKGLLP